MLSVVSVPVSARFYRYHCLVFSSLFSYCWNQNPTPRKMQREKSGIQKKKLEINQPATHIYSISGIDEEKTRLEQKKTNRRMEKSARSRFKSNVKNRLTISYNSHSSFDVLSENIALHPSCWFFLCFFGLFQTDIFHTLNSMINKRVRQLNTQITIII